jgi:hypothetical protein
VEPLALAAVAAAVAGPGVLLVAPKLVELAALAALTARVAVVVVRLRVAAAI